MSAPEVSVVVPSYRGADRLADLFEAFRRQTFTGEWELVVVLDGVVDHSPVVIDAFGDLPIAVVTLAENRGRPAALNAGFARAQGRILVRCDDDLGPQPNFLERHVRAHDGDAPVGVVGLCHDVLGDTVYARVYGNPANERLRNAAYREPPERIWKFWAANCSIDRASFDRVGPYDEAFREYGWEDVDWGYRLHCEQIPVVFDRGLEVRHQAASSSVAVRTRRSYLGGRARARFEDKHAMTPDQVAPAGMAQRAWSTAVQLATHLDTQDRFEWWAAQIDRAIRVLPRPVASRLVALIVEAAAIAGHRSFGGFGA